MKKHKSPFADLESQYTKQITKLTERINADFFKVLKEAMKAETVDETIERQLKQNSFKNILDKLDDLITKFKASKFHKKTDEAMQTLFENADKRVKRMIKKVYKDAKRDIPVLTLKKPSAMLKESIIVNAKLIKDITEAQSTNLRNAVVKAARQGFSHEIIEKEVLKTMSDGVNYAKFVSRDQLAKAHADINEERQKEAGFTHYIGVTVNDFKTRKSHKKAYEDKIIPWNDPPVLDFALDDPATKRGAERLHVGHDYGCRCYGVPSFGE